MEDANTPHGPVFLVRQTVIDSCFANMLDNYYYRYVRFYLKLVGLWPFDNSKQQTIRKWFIQAMFVLIIVYQVIFNSFEILHLIQFFLLYTKII